MRVQVVDTVQYRTFATYVNDVVTLDELIVRRRVCFENER